MAPALMKIYEQKCKKELIDKKKTALTCCASTLVILENWERLKRKIEAIVCKLRNCHFV